MLTGILEIAMLENICPPTWNAPIGNVALNIAAVGERNLLKLIAGVIIKRQQRATKPNWMIVRVTG